jgi:HSP20 family protein
MALPTTPTDSWTQSLDFPSRLFGRGFGGTDYELYEQDGEFVLTIEMPGFDPDEITLAWDDGVLNVAGEHTDEGRNRRKTYHRRFRFPKDIDDESITARYENGVLEVTLPAVTDATASGTTIPIEG